MYLHIAELRLEVYRAEVFRIPLNTSTPQHQDRRDQVEHRILDTTQEDTGYWILDTGYWILDTGYWILDTGYWILDTGYWILDILDTGYWIYWILDTGYPDTGRDMNTGYWTYAGYPTLDCLDTGGWVRDWGLDWLGAGGSMLLVVVYI